MKLAISRSWFDRRAELVLFLILLAAIALVYFVTYYPDQGWGDDFAQYIHQAINLTQGIGMQETGYIYSRYTSSLGPRAYPPGFPLLLAPTYALFGFDIGAFQIEIILLQIVALVVIYLLYRREVSRPTALILLLMMGLSPYLISFKRDIMSDVPFMLACLAFLLWIEYAYQRQRFDYWTVLVAVILAFVCYFIRTIGLVVLIALFIGDLLRRRRLTRFTLWTIIGTIILIFISRLIFGGGDESYFDQFANYSPQIMLQNVKHYLVDSIRGFWAGPSITLGPQFIMPVLWLIAIPLIIYGFIRRASRNTLFIELFFLLYLGIILIWPSIQELRFLYPILPLLLMYTGIGFEQLMNQIQRRIHPRVARAAAFVCALGLIAIYVIRTGDVIDTEGPLHHGPYTPSAIELFQFVSEETSADSVFVFYKPRALALYTDRRASTFPYNDTLPIAVDYLKEIDANYVIVNTDGTSPNIALASLIEASPNAFEQVFNNGDFTVYRVDPTLLSLPEQALSS